MAKNIVPNPFFDLADVTFKAGEVANTVTCRICGELLYNADGPDAKEKWAKVAGHFKGHGKSVVVS